MARCEGSKSIPPPPTLTAGDTQRVATWAGGQASVDVHAPEQGQPGPPPLSLRSNWLREQKLGGGGRFAGRGGAHLWRIWRFSPQEPKGLRVHVPCKLTSEPARCQNPQTPGSGTKNSALLTARAAAGEGRPIRRGSGEAPPMPACRGRGLGPGTLTLLHRYDLAPRKTLRCSVLGAREGVALCP